MNKDYGTTKQVPLDVYRGLSVLIFVCGAIIAGWKLLSIGAAPIQEAFLTAFLPYLLLVNMGSGLLNFKTYITVKNRNAVSSSSSTEVQQQKQTLGYWVVISLLINISSPFLLMSSGFQNLSKGTLLLDLLIIVTVFVGSLVAPIYFSTVEKKQEESKTKESKGFKV